MDTKKSKNGFITAGTNLNASTERAKFMDQMRLIVVAAHCCRARPIHFRLLSGGSNHTFSPRLIINSIAPSGRIILRQRVGK